MSTMRKATEAYLRKQAQKNLQDSYIAYFSRIVGTSKYRNHKFK